MPGSSFPLVLPPSELRADHSMLMKIILSETYLKRNCKADRHLPALSPERNLLQHISVETVYFLKEVNTYLVALGSALYS